VRYAGLHDAQIWIIAVLAGLLLILVPRLRTLRAGSRLNQQLLTGQFDSSSVGIQFATWFHEQPSRELQRQRFVELAIAMGYPAASVSIRVLRSIMRVWQSPQLAFGSSLADETDQLIVFDPATNPEQQEAQRKALAQLSDFKARLRQRDQT
jgi:hypothetical protein